MHHNWDIIDIGEIDSTNTYAHWLINNNFDLDEIVIFSLNQYKGRGQENNKWESEPYMNIAFSIILKPDYIDISRIFFLNMSVSLGIISFLNSIGIKGMIKWPNDILVDSKKISGILIENYILGNSFEFSIVGVGFNVNQIDFGQLDYKAVSLKNITNNNYNLEETLNYLLNHIWIEIERLKYDKFNEIKQDYITNLFQYGEIREYSHKNKTFKGKIIDVLSSGEIIIENENNEKNRYMNKEIIFL